MECSVSFSPSIKANHDSTSSQTVPSSSLSTSSESLLSAGGPCTCYLTSVVLMFRVSAVYQVREQTTSRQRQGGPSTGEPSRCSIINTGWIYNTLLAIQWVKLMQHAVMSKKSSQNVLGKIKGAHTFQSILQPNNQFPQLITSMKWALLCLVQQVSLRICACINRQGLTFEHSSNTALEI